VIYGLYEILWFEFVLIHTWHDTVTMSLLHLWGECDIFLPLWLISLGWVWLCSSLIDFPVWGECGWVLIIQLASSLIDFDYWGECVLSWGCVCLVVVYNTACVEKIVSWPKLCYRLATLYYSVIWSNCVIDLQNGIIQLFDRIVLLICKTVLFNYLIKFVLDEFYKLWNGIMNHSICELSIKDLYIAFQIVIVHHWVNFTQR